MDFDDLNRRMCEFARNRLDVMGEHEGGLERYYRRRVEAGVMLKPEDIAVAEHIGRVVPRQTPIMEICAGAAQLGHLLSLMGYSVAAVEIDPLRHAFATALGKHVGSRCNVVLGSWQALGLNGGLLVTINAATSHIAPADTDLLREHALGGGSFILRPRQFGAGIAADIPGLRATPITEDVYHYAR